MIVSPDPVLAPVPADAPQPRGSVLVVDDEELMRSAVTRALTRAGYAVTQACDGAQALDVLANTPTRFDLVLLDLSMPVLGGAACFRAARERDPELRVLLMSAHADAATVKPLIDAGARGLLPKPFAVPALVAAVEHALLDM